MNNTPDALQQLNLKFNPFPPATTGVAFLDDVKLPNCWEIQLQEHLNQLRSGIGDKALAIVGQYGSGKSFILHWIGHKVLPQYRLQPYGFDNPGVAFYDLANKLLSKIGRYTLSKALWELLYNADMEPEIQPQLIESWDYSEWLSTFSTRRDKLRRVRIIERLAGKMREEALATEDEIAYRFAQLIVDTRDRPYFEYRDFVPRSATAIVAEEKEAIFFRTLIKMLIKIHELEGVAFLIDEFEDVALGRRLSQRQVADYLATLRRLLDTAREEEFWLILSMTPEGYKRTEDLDLSLIERFSAKYEILPLADTEAWDLVFQRLEIARIESKKGLWPFHDDIINCLKPTTRSNPRRLIKVLWKSLAMAAENHQSLPISGKTVRHAETMLYPRTEHDSAIS